MNLPAPAIPHAATTTFSLVDESTDITAINRPHFLSRTKDKVI